MLIRDLTIQGYRCFEDFSMDGLTRVNLLVGNNNTGKTSFLEAVYLLVNQPSTGTIGKSLKEIFENRSEFSQQIEKIDHESEPFITRKYYVDRLFYSYSKDKIKALNILSTQDVNVTTRIVINHDTENLGLIYQDDKSSFLTDENQIEDIVFIKIFVFSSQGKIDEVVETANKISIKDLNEKNNFCHIIHSSLFFSHRQIDFEKVAKIWDDIELTPKEDIVIEALKIILPDIERIGFSSSQTSNSVRLKIKGYQQPVPLSSMGYGMNRILNLAIALVSTEKGVLLVDEIETGLHYEAQLDMWRLVLKTAQDLDVQVFATTHSWDCIAAFKEALQELEDQSVAKLFRLDSKYGKLRAVEYDAEEIRIAVNQGVEVR
jgi:AAA15 family ATPase/GTPase